MKHSDFLEKVGSLCESINALSEQGASRWCPSVEAMIAAKCRDHNKIERTLDSLLDLCSQESGTALFRKLCRYYWTINPESTAFYVNLYRETWDEESLSAKM